MATARMSQIGVLISANGVKSGRLPDTKGSGIAYVRVMAVTMRDFSRSRMWTCFCSEEQTMRPESLRQDLHPWRGERQRQRIRTTGPDSLWERHNLDRARHPDHRKDRENDAED